MSKSYSEAEAREIIRQSALVEDAAKALTALTDAEWEIATAEGTEHLTGYFDAARRVLAVFEKALGEATVTPTDSFPHGHPEIDPTDDEREALASIRAIRRMPDRREAVPIDDTVRRHAYLKGYEDAMDDVRARLPHHSKAPEPQGEPSDAQVMAAIQVFYNAPGVTDWVDETKEDMRAALRAAGEVR